MAVRHVLLRRPVGILGLVAALMLLFGALPAGAGTGDDVTPRAIWDDYFNPWVFATLPYSDVGDTGFATIQGGEPFTSCGGADSHSVWYAYTAGGALQITADTSGSNYDTVLAVYRDNWNTEIACNDDAAGLGSQSRVTFTTAAGHTYYFRVSDYWPGGGGGTVHFNVVGVAVAPANDNIANAQPVTTPLAFTESTGTATLQAGEPVTSCGGSDSHSVWFVYSPGASVQITANTFGSNYDTVLAVYRDNWNTEIACNDDAGGGSQSQVVFTASSGNTYYFRVSDYWPGGGGGTVHFNVVGTGGGALCQGQAATITGTAGAETIYGSAVRDVIVALGGNDTIYGYGGDDLICAGAGADTVYGGAGADALYGQAGNDLLYGQAGNDHLWGNAGADFLHGGIGSDTLRGGIGVDTCQAGEDVTC